MAKQVGEDFAWGLQNGERTRLEPILSETSWFQCLLLACADGVGYALAAIERPCILFSGCASPRTHDIMDDIMASIL
jgi:hypothetical protein